MMTIKILLISGLAGTAILWGQVVGASLSGTVKDDTGASLPGATVSVKNIETGAERRLAADDNGR